MRTTASHVYLQPVVNLRLTRDIGEELTIGGVLLVSSAKLRRIRRRLGLPWRVSEAPDWARLAIEEHETFGVVQVQGLGESALRSAEHQVREACAILRCASWPFAKRSRNNLLRVFGPSDVAYRVLSQRIVVNRQSGQITGTRTEQRRSLMPFELDHFWEDFQRAQGWLWQLTRFLREQSGAEPEWRGAVQRAAALFGESLQEADRPLAFLFNMMALDTVLLGRNDRSREMFPRLDAVLGWSNVGLPTPWFKASDLARLSRRRNELVHDGDSSRLQARDLVLADRLVGNLLSCTCRMAHRWPAREGMIQFTERVSCRRKLGISPYAQEGRLPLRVLNPQYSAAEIRKL